MTSALHQINHASLVPIIHSLMRFHIATIYLLPTATSEATRESKAVKLAIAMGCSLLHMSLHQNHHHLLFFLILLLPLLVLPLRQPFLLSFVGIFDLHLLVLVSL